MFQVEDLGMKERSQHILEIWEYVLFHLKVSVRIPEVEMAQKESKNLLSLWDSRKWD